MEGSGQQIIDVDPFFPPSTARGVCESSPRVIFNSAVIHTYFGSEFVMGSMTMGHTECPNCEERVLIKNDGYKSVCPNCGVIRENYMRKKKRYDEDLHKDEVVLTDPKEGREDSQISWVNGTRWPDDFEIEEVNLDPDHVEDEEEREDDENE